MVSCGRNEVISVTLRIGRVDQGLKKGRQVVPRASVIGSDQVHYTTELRGGGDREKNRAKYQTYTSEGEED